MNESEHYYENANGSDRRAAMRVSYSFWLTYLFCTARYCRIPAAALAEKGMELANSPDEEQSAFDALTGQVKQEPGNADVHATFAKELVRRNRLEEAQKEVERSLEIDPTQGCAYCAIGRIAAKQGHEDDSRTALLMAIKCDESNDDAYAALGDNAMKAKKYSLVVRFYRRVVHIVPHETEGHNKLIAALTAAGDAKGAERERQAAARLTARSLR